MNHIVEEESGTHTRPWHAHNGYYAGDFSDQPTRPLGPRSSDLLIAAAA